MIEEIDKTYNSVIDDIKQDINKTQLNIMINANISLVNLYYRIGKVLYDNSTWGNKFLDKLAFELKLSYPNPKGFSIRNLKYMKTFYIEYKDDSEFVHLCAQLPWKHNISLIEKVKDKSIRKWYMKKCIENQIWNPAGSKLSWNHYRELLVVKNANAIKYYIDICEKNNLTKIQLQERIKNHEYDRLSEDTKNKLMKSEELKVDDLIPNPIIIKANALNEPLTEYALKQMIINNLDEFLLQLGTAFAYIGNEFKIKVDGKYNYIDLLLFNYEYNCFVVIELKVTELKKEHIGQIQVYMNYIDDNLRKINQDKTIGIIICKQDNKYVIKYCSDDRIIAKEYELIK